MATRGWVPAVLLALAAGGLVTVPVQAVAAPATAATSAAPDDHDDGVRVDDTGRTYVVEPPFDPPAKAAAAAPDRAPYPLEETFSLHSDPDSTHVIYIDVDGAEVSGTAWNTGNGLPEGDYPAWTLDGDPTTFDDAERAAVQSIWQRVSEDFAPFDVDVTTEDPGPDAIARSSEDDQYFGAHALLSPSDVAVQQICGRNGCGGVAYVGVFDLVDPAASYQPAWVFPQYFGDDAKAIAEVVSHEVGHNFGLSHDGPGYYGGGGLWAPIMGFSYDSPVSQWSRGEYDGADNTEDDLAIIAGNGAPLRPDTVGDRTDPGGWPHGPQLINSSDDVDVFSLGDCWGPGSWTVSPAPTSPNLDVKVELYAVFEQHTADPVTVRVDADTASGMDATVGGDLGPWEFFLAVEGTGVGSASGTDGYSDYGSIGSYTVEGTHCRTPSPLDLTFIRGSDTGGTLSWTAPRTDGGSTITGYDVQVNNGGAITHYDAATRSAPVEGMEYGQFAALRVRATTTESDGDWGQLLATTTLPPTEPTALAAKPAPDGTSVALTWEPPADDKGSPVTAYWAELDGRDLRRVLPSEPLTASWSRLTPGSDHVLSVYADNRGGSSPTATLPVTLPGTLSAPDAPVFINGHAFEDGRRFALTWSAPTTGSPPQGYRVALDGVEIPGELPWDATSYTWTGLSPGTDYDLSVVAFNEVGDSAAATSTVTTATTAPDAPGDLTVTPTTGGTGATVAWTEPSGNGLPITGYTVGRTGAADQPTDASPYTWTGLTPGETYTFTVTATNARGAGLPAEATVTMPAAPDPPRFVNGNAGEDGRSFTLVWADPTGPAPSGYRVELDGQPIPGDLPADARSYTWTGLSPATSYSLSVRAFNDSGESGPSTSNVSTARTAPDAPGDLVVTPSTDGTSAVVSWTAPAANGFPISGYTVGRTGAADQTTGDSPYTWTGLIPGAEYTFTVNATNERGTGPAASRTVTMPSIPGPPRFVNGYGFPDGRSFALVWAPPTGGTPSGYRVELDGVAIPGELPADARSYTWTGLSPGTDYDLTVVAFNDTGESAPSTSSVTTTRTAPDAPGALVVSPSADGTSAVVGWTAPAANGFPITGYTVTRTGAADATTGSSPYTWTGLTPGATYTFTVTATNERGAGPTTVGTVTMPTPVVPPPVVVPPPFVVTAPPGTPDIGKARSGKRGGKATATVRWSDPTYGGPVTGYVVVGYRLDRNGKLVKTVTSALLPATVTQTEVRVPRGRYRFAVVAAGAAGQSAPSSRSVVVRSR